LFAGFFSDVNGTKTVAQGSFITAAIFLSFLVIPVIARCTEEGLRSLPNELREGSLALGASKEYTLARILLPWSAPNIITGLILGCAEVAGGVAVIMFIAGNGGHGIGGIWPLGETTSLDYMVFGVQSTDSLNYKDLMGYYQWSAALLVLIIALGLSIAGVVLKHKFSKRYRGT
jgi:phosphate transport system permease protein